MHLRSVFRLVARIMIFIAFLMLIPTMIAVYFNETGAIKGFVITVFLMIFSGFFAFLPSTAENYDAFTVRDGILFTALSWTVATLFGALPLLLSGTFPDFTSCFFEIMSGFTTTGATVLTDIESCSKSILFWRSMTNWLGGMGIVVLFVAFLPAINAGAGTFNIIGAESVGPVKGKLTPKTKSTAVWLWTIYLGFTVLETIFLLFGGLSLYDAVTVSFSTLSAAGFCVKNASIGAFNSAYVEVIVIIFMFIAGMNFALYYKAFTGKLKSVLRDTEMHWYATITLFSSVLGAAVLVSGHVFDSFAVALRKMTFHVVSILTTTGFATADYTLWPSFPVMLLFFVSLIGGCAGSAGGGMKVTRISVVCKSGLNTIKKKIHPSAVVQIRDGEGVISHDIVESIFTFVCVYIITWIVSSVIISLTGQDLLTCLSSTLLTLGNIGIGFGKVNPTGSFAIFPLWSRWLFSFLMMVGRLELFTVYVVLSRAFWKR